MYKTFISVVTMAGASVQLINLNPQLKDSLEQAIYFNFLYHPGNLRTTLNVDSNSDTEFTEKFVKIRVFVRHEPHRDYDFFKELQVWAMVPVEAIEIVVLVQVRGGTFRFLHKVTTYVEDRLVIPESCDPVFFEKMPDGFFDKIDISILRRF